MSNIGIYKESRANYLEFINMFKSLVHALLAEESRIPLVQITGHLKSVDDMGKEVEIMPDGSYPVLSEFQNLMTLRVVTFYEKDVALAIRRLNNAFQVSEVSIQEKDDPKAHGYPGSTMLLKLGENRLQLDEYKRFTNMQIEVQVYSMFQDVWSKIARHIGYPEEKFPKERLREYKQLAYLMELADSELNNNKNSIPPYNWGEENKKTAATKKQVAEKERAKQKIEDKREAVKQAAEAKAAAEKPLVPLEDLPPMESVDKTRLRGPADNIDQDGLDNLILGNDMARNLDKLIADTYNTRLMYQGRHIDSLVAALLELEQFKNTGEIEAKLFEKRRPIMELAVYLFGDPKVREYEHIPKGVSLFLLAYHTIAASRNIKLAQRFLGKYSFDDKVVNKNTLLW